MKKMLKIENICFCLAVCFIAYSYYLVNRPEFAVGKFLIAEAIFFLCVFILLIFGEGGEK